MRHDHISPTQVELLPGPQGSRLLWVRLPGVQVVLRLASDVGPNFVTVERTSHHTTGMQL